MRRVLAGSLTHLAPAALLRLLSATAPSGVLELSTEAGDLRLETAHGKVTMPSPGELRRTGRVLRSSSGSFRFAPSEVRPIEGRALTLNALADAAETSDQVWQAVVCHRTQLPGYDTLQALPHEQKRALWSIQEYYRAFSLVNGGRQVEMDLFEGLRNGRHRAA